MAMKVSDPIRGQSRGSMGQANAYAASYGAAHQSDVEMLIRELYRLGAIYGVDAAILVAQSAHETDNWRSAYWKQQRNPAGLGAFDDGTYVGGVFPNGTVAAQAQFAHMLAYLGIDAPDDLARTDPRYSAVRPAGFWGSVTRISDLGRGRWATDQDYATKLAAKGNAIYPQISDHIPLITLPAEEPSMSLTFGKVPHPPYQNRPIWKPEGAGQNNLGKRSVKGVVWHRILGSLWGTDQHFRQAGVNALTDYGVGVKAQDGVANAGLILRWNDPLGFQSGWASGKVIAPWGDGAAFVNKYGLNAVNRDQVSIEVSGFYGTALDEAARNAIAGITAYWADQDGIPWDVFPIRPQDGFSFVRWHQEFTGPQEKVCPGEVVMNETNALIERTRAILKRYQTGTYEQPQTPDGTVYAAPITYDWLTDEEAAKGLDRVIGRTRVFYVPQVYEAINETPRKQATGKNEKIIGPPIPKGTKFRADYCYRSAGVSYVLTPYGTRVRAADLLPKIQISTRGTVSVRRTPDQVKGEVIRKADS